MAPSHRRIDGSTSGQGLWLSSGETEEDNIAVVEVMVEHLDRTFCRSLRERLERELTQEEIAIRAQEITLEGVLRWYPKFGKASKEPGVQSQNPSRRKNALLIGLPRCLASRCCDKKDVAGHVTRSMYAGSIGFLHIRISHDAPLHVRWQPRRLEKSDA